MRNEIAAATGTELRCKGWRQEGLLRMLENTIANGERPEDLIIYGSTGQAARNWESFHAIVDILKTLENDETLVVQSGKPVAVFKSHPGAPRVMSATSNLVPRHANREEFDRLRELRDELAGRPEWSGFPGKLSMGMSHDFEIAIAAGATHVRVGTDLFGARP